VYFVGDLGGLGRKAPQSEGEWSDALEKQARHLGIPADPPSGHPLFGKVHKVFLHVAGVS
jgi:hypothetical protein